MSRNKIVLCLLGTFASGIFATLSITTNALFGFGIFLLVPCFAQIDSQISKTDKELYDRSQEVQALVSELVPKES